MANLSIRKLDEEVFSRLRILATTHGISMEEEVRQILKQALTQQVKLGDIALQLFGEAQGVDLELSEYTAHEPLDLLQ